MTKHVTWMRIADAMFDQKPIRVDAVACHALGDVHDELIACVAELFKSSGASKIILNGAKEYEVGSPGIDYWRRQLEQRHSIDPTHIIATTPSLHTGAEAQAFTDVIEREGIASAAIVSAPYHILRAFLTDLGVAQKRGLSVTLYPRTFKDVQWLDPVSFASVVPGELRENTTRLGRFASELARIIEYSSNVLDGNERFAPIASPEEGLAYLATLPQ